MIEILYDNEHHIVLIVNKTDKLNQKELSTQLRSIENECPGVEILPYSAVVNKGAGFVLEKLIA